MELFKLDKPDLTKADGEKIIRSYVWHRDANPALSQLIRSASEPIYLYWDTIKHKPPPHGLSSIEYWSLIKHARNLIAQLTYIRAESGKHFVWFRQTATDEYLHKIDMHLGGEIFTQYSHIITTYGKQRLLTKSIIEESIASSQLEGAATTTPVAKKMLLENRKPRDTSEQMIVNNYKTMQALNETYKDQKLSHPLLLELHELMTKNTLDADKQGRYRKDNDDITVNDGMQYIYHVPPKEVFLMKEIERLIGFANDEDGGGFLHPIIKAIFLHFWIGYLHPFYDGNGRIARTIFYWYLLRKGYWAIQYLPISLVLKHAHIQYGMAYVYSEQDDCDITYFYDFHMRKLLLAIRNFTDYIQRKTQENTLIEGQIGIDETLNDRQKELLKYLFIKGKEQYVTPSSYIELNKISRMTARNDLRELEELNLLFKKRAGTYIRYFTTDLLRKKVKKTE